FYVQDLLVQMCGEDAAGKMHTARSRNDIDLTLYRMQLRLEVLRIAEETAQGRQVLIELAEAHTDTVMPAHTHTQPAQPTTLAHYLLGAAEFLGRDVHRLRAAFATINRSPLGACAITTTGFPIRRDYTARLLGFDGLQENSYGAIAATDYVCEAAAAIAELMVSLSKRELSDGNGTGRYAGARGRDQLSCGAPIGFRRRAGHWAGIFARASGGGTPTARSGNARKGAAETERSVGAGARSGIFRAHSQHRGRPRSRSCEGANRRRQEGPSRSAGMARREACLARK